MVNYHKNPKNYGGLACVLIRISTAQGKLCQVKTQGIDFWRLNQTNQNQEIKIRENDSDVDGFKF